MALDASQQSVSDVDLAALWQDPYPTFAALRRQPGVPFVAAANRYMVARHADIVWLERHPEIFSAAEQESLMHRVMGLTMLRLDGDAHRRLRKATEAPMRPRVVKQHWKPIFQEIADELIDGFVGRGQADLFTDFAAPMAARSLAAVLGLHDVADTDLCEWSQAMMDGCGNYSDDPEIWRRAEAASAGVDRAVELALARVADAPDTSIISAMVHADDPMDPVEVAANVKVIIGGGLNEPRDATTVGVYGLLTHPQARAAVADDPARFSDVFEETVRWVSPIGMYPRQTTQEVELSGTLLPAGARVGVLVSSANRDEAVFRDPERFDIDRPNREHVAFGGGPHFCLGTWVARMQVGQVSLPTIMRRLPGLRLDPDVPARFGGWVFRGLLNLPVRWVA